MEQAMPPESTNKMVGNRLSLSVHAFTFLLQQYRNMHSFQIFSCAVKSAEPVPLG